MDSSEKKARAVAFINRMRDIPPGELNALILQQAGEELARFFLTYSSSVLTADPSKALEHGSSLMLMGYLIRAAEEAPAPRMDA